MSNIRQIPDSCATGGPGLAPVFRILLRQLTIMGLVSVALLLYGRPAFALFVIVIAAIFAVLAILYPGAYLRTEAFGRRLGQWAGTGISVLLLGVVFCVCFVPARVILLIARADPLRREFPSSSGSCWFEHRKNTGLESYGRQS